MASQDDVQITVKVDAGGAIKAFDALGQEIEGVNVVNSQAKEGFSNLGATLVSLEAGLSIASRAFNIVSSAASTAFEAISRGAQVDDVAQAFENLSNKAGATAETFLSELNSATMDTVSNFDLMQKANKAMLAGLSPDQFIIATNAAKQFAEEVGGNLTDELDGLVLALQKGDDRFLKQHSILIDNKKVQEDYARSINSTIEALTEEDKAQAMRLGMLDALAVKAAEGAQIQKDAGDNIQTISKLWADSTDAAYKAAAANTEVNTALKAIGESISSIDFTPLMVGFARTAQIAAESVTNFQMIGKYLAVMGLAIQQNKTFDQMAKEVLQAEEAVKQLDVAAQQAEFTQRNWASQVKYANDQLKAQGKFIGPLAPAIESTTNAIDRHRRELELAAKSHKTLLERVDMARSGVEKITSAYMEGSISEEQMSDETIKLEAALRKAGATAAEAGKLLNNQFSKQVDEGTKAIEKMQDEMAKMGEQTFLGSMFGADSGAMSSLGAQMGDALGEGLRLALDKSAKGEDWKAFTESLGGDIGGAIGASIGGPAGEAIGQVLGEKLGGAIFDAFGGGDTGGTKARKKLDSYFADLFDGDRLGVIINGQFERIDDLVFNQRKGKGIGGSLGKIGATMGNVLGGAMGAAVGGALGNALENTVTQGRGNGLNIGEEGWDNLFRSLPDAARRGFEGVGDAFTLMAGEWESFGAQLGAVFANNIGGSLNNLQLLVKATGASGEEMKSAIVTAFEDGTMRALEAQSALLGIQNVMQNGIPDGVGMLDTAFKNLEAAGTKGGAALVDALQDIGFEAQELGIKDFPGIAEELKKRLPESAAAIDSLMAALASTGIGSIDALTSATTEQLLPALAQLESTDFPFAKATEEANKLLETMKQYPEEIHTKIIVDVETNDPAGALPKIQNTSSTGQSQGVKYPNG